MWQNIWKPSSLIKFSLNKLSINVSLTFSLEKIFYDLFVLDWYFLKLFLMKFKVSHQMEIRQPCLYYASTLKVVRYICNQRIKNLKIHLLCQGGYLCCFCEDYKINLQVTCYYVSLIQHKNFLLAFLHLLVDYMEYLLLQKTLDHHWNSCNLTYMGHWNHL